MTKKKVDHLFQVNHLVNSVLHRKAVTSLCGGLTKTFTREDFEDTTYRNSCAACMGTHAAGGDPMVIRTKTDWLGLLERAYLIETAPKISVTVNGGYTWSATYITTPNTTTNLPPAA